MTRLATVFSGMIGVGLALTLFAAGCGGSGGGRCTNGVLDPIETDLDCGGFCGPCAGGQRCVVATDCLSLDCAGGVCAANAASCTDGRLNGHETDVDCGGPDCSPCRAQQACTVPTDCASEVCEGGACALPPTCADAQLTAGETDIDCGGLCLPCANDKNCREHADCLSQTCTFGVCAAPTCDDGVRNQGEPSVDCGGPCDPCALGQTCNAPADCESGACEGGACCAPNACGFCGESPTDVCDGADNDCDGTTDDPDEIGAPPECELQAGVCAGALTRCGGEPGWICEASDYAAHDARYEVKEQSCDGIDNDCDGLTDEGEDMPDQPLCAEQRGVCAGAVAPCHGDQGSTCLPADYAGHSADYEAGEETLCDHLDNDCDGQTDEGLRNHCGACAPEPPELCNGLDDDCDGLTDETPECAACTGDPTAITDSELPRQIIGMENGGGGFRLGSGRICGYFTSYGADEDNNRDTRALFYCLDDGVPTVVGRRLEPQGTDQQTARKRVVVAAGGSGDDIVYAVRDAGVSMATASHEIYRLSTDGSGTAVDISASFPRLEAGDEIAIVSSPSKLYVLAYPTFGSSDTGLTLTTLSASGSVSSQTISTPEAWEVSLAIGPGASATPVVTYLDDAPFNSSSEWHVWHAGADLGSVTNSVDLSHAVGVDSQGGVHYAEPGGGELAHHLMTSESFTTWEANGTDDTLTRPLFATSPGGEVWLVVYPYSGDVVGLLPVTYGQATGYASRRSLGSSHSDAPRAALADAGRVHVLFGDERSEWNTTMTPEIAEVWGYHMEMCVGISDPQ